MLKSSSSIILIQVNSPQNVRVGLYLLIRATHVSHVNTKFVRACAFNLIVIFSRFFYQIKITNYKISYISYQYL